MTAPGASGRTGGTGGPARFAAPPGPGGGSNVGPDAAPRRPVSGSPAGTDRVPGLAVREAPGTAPAGRRGRVRRSEPATPDVYVVRPSPLGPAYVAVSAVGVAAVSLDACASDFEAAYERRFRRPVVPAADPLPMLAELDRALTEGNPGSLPLDLRGLSPFAAAVLTVTAAIPRGEVRTYAEVAAAVGRPGAARAVGGALARNPVPLVVPCHRVVRSGGHLGGYGWGPARKRALLAAEGAPVGALAPASSSNSRR